MFAVVATFTVKSAGCSAVIVFGGAASVRPVRGLSAIVTSAVFPATLAVTTV
jgi:hypothetical protein